jgi:hypothetical protein
MHDLNRVQPRIFKNNVLMQYESYNYKFIIFFEKYFYSMTLFYSKFIN